MQAEHGGEYPVPITISDVAQLAGVSIKTVSRVINKEPNVRAKTRDKVAAVIRETGYEPNPSARGLASRRSNLIALFYDDLMAESTYVVNVQRGLLQCCRSSGYELLVHPLKYHEKGIRNIPEEITRHSRQTRIDGVILTPPLCDLQVVIRTLEKLNLPFVRLSPGQYESGSMCVHTNDRVAARSVTEHLLQLGHRQVALIAGHSGHKAVKLRERGFREAMEAAGLTVDEHWVLQGESLFEPAYNSALKLLGEPHRPTAIFALTDDMAAGVISAAHELGIAVPEQLSVAGFDDAQIAKQLWPTLTTVRQPIQEMAEAATNLLLDQLHGRNNPVREIAMDTQLIMRNSTGPAMKN